MELVTIRDMKDPISSSANFNADILPGRSVVIHGQSGRRRTDEEGRFSRRFEFGDMAEYHSYNLSYYGPITSITAKGVTIDAGMGEGRKRLKWVDFIRRNWNFNLEETERRNDSERQCL